MTQGSRPGELAEHIGVAVLGHPAVLRLDAGAFGTVATLLPGKRVVGVQVVAAEPPATTTISAVEVSVVLAFGSPIPDVTDQLRDRVRALAGAVRVDIHVSDMDTS
ncbi:MAG: hypothetical protein M3548_08610 [Actinomycetota bacterium]|nr:hypothetical protein [Actinomycetota bacterium]